MISCDENALYYEPVMWVFGLIKRAYKIDLIADHKMDITVGINDDKDILVSNTFYEDLLVNRKFAFENYFDSDPVIYLNNGRPDYVSSIFYLVNGFQEYHLREEQKDKYGRLDYRHSLHHHFDILQKDLVKEYIQKLLFEINPDLLIPKRKTRIFLSHDIDSVYGSLKYDGLWALRKGNIYQMMKVIMQTVLQNPPWFNIDKVAKLENEYDVKACYYWIVENGRSEDGIKNGDYQFNSRKIQEQLQFARQCGNEMGLHKSTMGMGFDKEMVNMHCVESNRFHFLKIDNPISFLEMEQSGIRSDSSIGFPYHMGFKNSFGMPYYPYDAGRKGKVDVLEIPLQVMDGMFDISNAESGEKAYSQIVDFIETNNTNAIISILWHNSEMTNFAYKWSFNCYMKLLQYFVDMNFETVLPSQLVKEYESA